jgi:hypothetical protein
MTTFHTNGNLILQQAFKSKSDRYQIAAYNAVMTCLAARGLLVDLQILDNEASVEYKEALTFKWNAKFQLVPPDMHCQNRAERAIRMFKDHFLAILAGVDSAFPPYLWDLLLPQVELTLNLLCQPLSMQGLVCGNFSKAPSTATRCHLVRLVVTSSSMQSWLLGNLGTSTQNQASILVLPLIPTAASS